jgi:hypothetical protein
MLTQRGKRLPPLPPPFAHPLMSSPSYAQQGTEKMQSYGMRGERKHFENYMKTTSYRMTSAVQPTCVGNSQKHSRCRPCVTVKFTQQVMSYDPSTVVSLRHHEVVPCPNSSIDFCSFHVWTEISLLFPTHPSRSPRLAGHCARHVYR